MRDGSGGAAAAPVELAPAVGGESDSWRWRRQNPLTQARLMAPGPFWYTPPPRPPPFYVPVESLP